MAFVDGKVRIERMRRKLASIATRYSLVDLEWILLLLVGSHRIKQEAKHIVPKHHVEVCRTIEAVLYPSSDTAVFRTAWSELLDTLDSLLQIGRPNLPMPGASDEMQSMIDVARSELEGASVETALWIFDDVFYRLANQWKPTDRRHHEFVAALAMPWIGAEERAFELYGTSGELFSNWRQPPAESVWLASVAQFDGIERGFAYAMRLLIRRVRAIQNIGPEPWQSAPFLLIDQVSATKAVHSWRAGDPGHAPADSGAASLLVQAALSNSDAVVLAIVGRQDRFGPARYKRAREVLVQGGSLAAVIDFDSFAPSGRRVALSAWLTMGRHFRKPNSVLFVDARHLLQDRSLAEGEQVLRLASHFARHWSRGFDLLDMEPALADAPLRLNRYFGRTFESGYHDVPGFCRAVEPAEMAAKDWALRAEVYVGEPNAPEWKLGLDTGPIWRALSANSPALCMYLIGNNGSGKSRALRELSIALADSNQVSLGLAFGTTDRFTFAPREALGGHFIYLGARTSATGISVKVAMARLGDQVRKIHSEPRRLQAFEQAIGRFDFSDQQYFLPLGLRTRSDITPDVLGDVHPLTTDAEQNRALFEGLPEGRHKLGLMRHHASVDSDGNRQPVGTIVALDELSSGEQQALTLIIRVLAAVQTGATVLVDEPEISLHVGWQRQIPAVLSIIARHMDCKFVVATHSPVVIAAAQDSHDLCFSVSRGRLRALEPRELRSVEATLFEGFNTYTDNTRQIHERCAEIVARAISDLDEQAGAEEGAGNTQLHELDVLRKKLESLKVADTTSGRHDLDLIAKARAAIVELLSLGA